ncbi:putative glycosyltransferase [Cylindrospermum stagnale PCC 7417]|uniref:Putative glycosyltransferase n=1 Tax=Cylindrospermum stagnale PCC 7417 TaxID=56107 RepID=K9X256_9NOST|nr:glycosyltransferase [Cylindrospermum stagnale]AFZ26725.1 putative glycosyltransferase [Cylindrospermum stagnale PCC 7417]
MDIIICTYNNDNLLDRVLTALSLSKVSPGYQWTVLVVDNNCTDDTGAVVERHINLQLIPGLRRIVEPKQGLTHARLCGIKNTTSEWLAFVDDDCLLSADWIDKARQFAETHPNCGTFGGKVVLDWEITPSPILVKHSGKFAANERGETSQQLNRRNYQIPGAGLVMRRTAIEKSGWLDKQLLNDREGKKLSAGGDSEIVLRILNAGYELWYTPDCVLHHFIPTKRMSETYLFNLMYGFGAAAPYIAVMRWHRSYYLWLLVSILRIFKGFLQIIACYVKALINPKNQAETLIMWNWTKGQIHSLFTILRMRKEEHIIWLSLFQ